MESLRHSKLVVLMVVSLALAGRKVGLVPGGAGMKVHQTEKLLSRKESELAEKESSRPR